jgi:hypothetical protein
VRQVGAILGIEIDRRTQHNVNISTHKEWDSRPLSIYFTGFSSQGDGACFEGSYRYALGATAKHAKPGAKITIREYAPVDQELHRIADALQALQRKNFYKLTARVKHRGHYYHSLCTEIDVEGAHDTATEDTLAELLRDFMHWIYRQLEREHDYIMSDECVDESILANEYTFDEDGHRI